MRDYSIFQVLILYSLNITALSNWDGRAAYIAGMPDIECLCHRWDKAFMSSMGYNAYVGHKNRLFKLPIITLFLLLKQIF